MDWKTLKSCLDDCKDNYAVTFYYCKSNSKLPFIDITISEKQYNDFLKRLKGYKNYKKTEQFYNYRNTSMILSKDKKWFRKMTYGDTVFTDFGVYVPWLSEKISEDQFPILSDYSSSGTRESVMYHVENITIKLVKETDEDNLNKSLYLQIDVKKLDKKTEKEWNKLQEILD